MLGALVGTPTHWHVQNLRTMLSRHATVSLLYVFVTAFANRESSRVKPHTIATPSGKRSVHVALQLAMLWLVMDTHVSVRTKK